MQSDKYVGVLEGVRVSESPQNWSVTSLLRFHSLSRPPHITSRLQLPSPFPRRRQISAYEGTGGAVSEQRP